MLVPLLEDCLMSRRQQRRLQRIRMPRGRRQKQVLTGQRVPGQLVPVMRRRRRRWRRRRCSVSRRHHQALGLMMPQKVWRKQRALGPIVGCLAQHGRVVGLFGLLHGSLRHSLSRDGDSDRDLLRQVFGSGYRLTLGHDGRGHCGEMSWITEIWITAAAGVQWRNATAVVAPGTGEKWVIGRGKRSTAQKRTAATAGRAFTAALRSTWPPIEGAGCGQRAGEIFGRRGCCSHGYRMQRGAFTAAGLTLLSPLPDGLVVDGCRSRTRDVFLFEGRVFVIQSYYCFWNEMSHLEVTKLRVWWIMDEKSQRKCIFEIRYYTSRQSDKIINQLTT